MNLGASTTAQARQFWIVEVKFRLDDVDGDSIG